MQYFVQHETPIPLESVFLILAVNFPEFTYVIELA
ncbi:hypothetical protein SAMN04488577_0447 [Bacillus sp. cl95]|nr:hypothetical protein SAMN02799634_101162 [Bacillus sp. UNCCL13]SFQ60954.1 hypothetical protein SAMN04488577_0447 [Bacillus sp. cl95]